MIGQGHIRGGEYRARSYGTAAPGSRLAVLEAFVIIAVSVGTAISDPAVGSGAGPDA